MFKFDQNRPSCSFIEQLSIKLKNRKSYKISRDFHEKLIKINIIDNKQLKDLFKEIAKKYKVHLDKSTDKKFLKQIKQITVTNPSNTEKEETVNVQTTFFRKIFTYTEPRATSIEKAVTFEEAKLTVSEQYWLNYFAGVFLGKIKKTNNHLYYI